MSYIEPSEFVTKMVDAGETKSLHVDQRYHYTSIYGGGYFRLSGCICNYRCY